TLALAAPAALARPTQEPLPPPEHPAPEIAYRHSVPVGVWWNGALRRGVQMPAEGPDWFTWDPVRKRIPNRGWRRWGTDRLVRTVLGVIEQYRLENALAPRVGIGDLSRTHGGDFGARFGGLGHASHQNGLDADIYYPRMDGQERRPYKPSQVDVDLAQDLVDRFVAAGARVIYVGPSLGLEGPRKRVVPLVEHDDHLHVRLQLKG
ncbi:MAG TPA: penicillin-insensitive murein endopeptidase, partial [Solirubrobacteraceae bacterium]|nr:penicillin-insensitive murein endopeptidase [Solirubrobacteraceae bacterium]